MTSTEASSFFLGQSYLGKHSETELYNPQETWFYTEVSAAKYSGPHDSSPRRGCLLSLPTFYSLPIFGEHMLGAQAWEGHWCQRGGNTEDMALLSLSQGRWSRDWSLGHRGIGNEKDCRDGQGLEAMPCQVKSLHQAWSFCWGLDLSMALRGLSHPCTHPINSHGFVVWCLCVFIPSIALDVFLKTGPTDPALGQNV